MPLPPKKSTNGEFSRRNPPEEPQKSTDGEFWKQRDRRYIDMPPQWQCTFGFHMANFPAGLRFQTQACRE